MAHDPGRPNVNEYRPYFSRYIDLVPDGNVTDHLTHGFERTFAALSALTPDQAHHRYAPDKWSVQEVIGHLCDAERVFAYRALRFARADTTPLEGFDEGAWMPYSRFDEREFTGLLDEWRGVRAASVGLFSGLGADAWLRVGTASAHPASVRALSYIIAGHELHHLASFRERYGVLRS